MMEAQNSKQTHITGLEIRQQNIHIIASCLKEIHECLSDIEKVSQSFLGKTINQVPSLEKYVPNFLKIIRVIRAVIKNSLALGSQVVVYFEQGKIDLELSQIQFQEAIDRIFELNILTGHLEEFDKELKQHLKQAFQFQHKAETRKDYVNEIVDRGEIALLRDLYTLNVRRGLYGIRSGLLDGDVALKEDSIYNSQRVSNQTIQYFRKVTQQLKIETRPILTEVRQIIAKKQPEATRDNSHRFIISILASYNHALTELIQD